MRGGQKRDERLLLHALLLAPLEPLRAAAEGGLADVRPPDGPAVPRLLQVLGHVTGVRGRVRAGGADVLCGHRLSLPPETR